jgi:tRNA pseudouridine38-40 synthase
MPEKTHDLTRYKLLIEYDGSRYSGWQIQQNNPTVQGKIAEAVIAIIGKVRFDLQGAGRTDRGVHALGQVAHLEIPRSTDPKILQYKLNDSLPKDINILQVTRASNSFHARKDAIARSYLYQVSRRRSAFGKNYAWWVKDTLSVERMAEFCAGLKGVHDFSSFSEKDEAGVSPKLLLEELAIEENGMLILLHFRARYFLWKMVRRLTGVIVEVGRGKLSVSEALSYLEKRSGKPAELTAPPAGLFLEKVYYNDAGEEQGIKPALFTAME